jgi:acyl carrier protein
MIERNDAREEVIDFLRSIARPGRFDDQVDDHTNLIDAGVIDSLALIQIIQYLEQQRGLKLAANGIDPRDLNSISGILDAASQATK